MSVLEDLTRLDEHYPRHAVFRCILPPAPYILDRPKMRVWDATLERDLLVEIIGRFSVDADRDSYIVEVEARLPRPDGIDYVAHGQSQTLPLQFFARSGWLFSIGGPPLDSFNRRSMAGLAHCSEIIKPMLSALDCFSEADRHYLGLMKIKVD